MKTKLSSLPLSEDGDDQLLTYFCGCDLSGVLASQEEACPTRFDEDLVQRAYRLGEMMFTKFCEGNCSVIKRFNEKVGL
jgi:hypothetical protein